MDELISRQAAIDAINSCRVKDNYMFVWRTERNQTLAYAVEKLNTLPSAQPEIIYCKDCIYWHSGSCEYPEHAVNCQDYMVGDMETEAEHFCGYAERRGVTK